MAGQSTILSVERHKVRQGETLDSIARSAGITWQDLAVFNFGTADPDEINQHLRDDVGCTKRSGNGANYFFTDFDNPGIVLVPHPWRKPGLTTDQIHHVKVRPLMIVVDYEFLHEGDKTNLSFTIRGRQPKEVFVRLYECSTQASESQRREWIRAHAANFQDKPGYRKSCRYCEVQAGDSLESLAGTHGVDDPDRIRSHFENEALRELRGDSFSLAAGDFVFIPQIDRNGPVPLGDVLSVKPAAEQAKNGKRYTAVWDNVASGYDPLDWTEWMPETASSIPVLRNMDFADGDSGDQAFYVPQFAVLIEGFVPIGVSPPPMWLVHLSQLERPSESDAFRVFLTRSASRAMEETTAEFAGPEEPLTFYSALQPGGGGEESS